MRKKIATFVDLSALSLSAYDLNVHGFINATAGKTDNKETSVVGYGNTKAAGQESNADAVKFQPDSLMGIQVSSNVSDNFSATLQLIGKFDNDEANVNLEWAYVAYNIESLQIQMGRYQPAVYMFSNNRHVAYGYLWTRLPRDVYGAAPITYLDGVNVIYNYEFDNDMNFNAKAFYGTTSMNDNVAGQDYTLIYDNTYGVEVALSNEYVKLRAGYSHPTLSGIFPGTIIDTTPGLKVDNTAAEFYSLGLSVDYNDILLISEVTKRRIEPSMLAEELNNYYVTLGYRINKFTPNITYSSLKSKLKRNANPLINKVKAGFARDQNSIITGLRYDIDTATALKLEWLRADQKQLQNSVSNTVTNLYTISLNIVF